MATPYIWLGENAEVAANGSLNQPLPGTNKWTIRPLLGWLPVGSDNHFTPALLIHHDNPALAAVLAALGAERDANDPDLNDAIGATWHVYRFQRLTSVQPVTNDGGTLRVDLADFVSDRALLPHKASPEVTLQAPSTAVSIGPRDLLTLDSSPTLKVEIPTVDGPVRFTLTLQFKELNLNPLHDGLGLHGLRPHGVTVSWDSGSGNIQVNGQPLNNTSVPDNQDVILPVTGPVQLALDSTGGLAGFDIQIGKGSYTHQPLVSGLGQSKVVIEWDAFSVRLQAGRLGLAPPPGGGTDEKLATATFSLPLIQAAVDPEAVNALAKLVPASQETAGVLSGVLAPLSFTVELRRPRETVPVPRVLFSFEPVAGAAATLVRDALEALRSVFVSDGTPKTTLSGLFAPLQELTALTGSRLEVLLEPFAGVLQDLSGDLLRALQALDRFNTRDYPLPVALRVRQADSGRTEFLCLIVFRLNLWNGRMASDRAYFYLAAATDGSAASLDLTAFAVQLPTRTPKELADLVAADVPDGEPSRPNEKSHDGYVDLAAAHLVFDFKTEDPAARPQVAVLFPGGLEENREVRRRVRLLLEGFDPETWPQPGPNLLQLRIGARGLTLSAQADTATPAAIPVPGVDGPELPLTLVEARDGLRSALVVRDNVILFANLAGRLAVPGLESLEADVQLGLRRDTPEGPPVVTAVIDLDRTDRKPLARLRVPFLKVQVDDLRMQLNWRRETDGSDWQLGAWASGSVSLISELGATGGVSNLDQPEAIPFQDVDLVRLHHTSGRVRLGRARPADQAQLGPGGGAPSTGNNTARFDLLDGQFRVEFTESELEWNLPDRTFDFTAERASFLFQGSGGDLDVAVEAGRVRLHLRDGRLAFRLPEYLGLQVRIGTQLAFAGEVGWVDDEREHYFRADGRLQLSGFPQITGALKLGTGVKEDGSTVPNVAIFGALPFEAELFAGAVMKEIGLGLGLNNRLAALGDRPDARTVLANIDRIDPEKSRNWSFVSEKGFYLSVVATTTITANRGSDTVISPYVARLVLSIDTNLDIVAAGRVWIFSSVAYAKRADNEQRPALLAAADFKPRAQSFSLLAQTHPRPAIEANRMLADLLSRAQARFSFYLSPDLADYYLEELSYQDELFGVSVQAFASYRIAIGRFGALARAQISLRGNLPQRSLSLGIGGFTFSGALQFDADFGGLVSQEGLAAHGRVRVGIAFRVSAFILLPTLSFEVRTFEETFSISISIPYLSCKRWRCKWKTHEIRETFTIRISIVVPVVKIEPYHLPETTLELVLEGAVAFNESGGIGFSGTLAISTTICGHPLRIAPRFDHRPEVVRSVQQRAAAVEDRINQLRGLPRPPQPLPADNGSRPQPSEETWYYYTSEHGDQVYHLLVPSPEQPTWWYTPHATEPGQYANLPRDTAVLSNGTNGQRDPGAASGLERRHLSPFRGAVMRMVLPFVVEDSQPPQVVDLAMPWDRGNADALPDFDVGLTDEQRIALVMRLTDIEATLLNTAALADNQLAETEQWEEQEADPNRVPLTGVEVVSDPRPESGARVFWTLTDQVTRPDGVLPYRYRPVEELVAEGFAGVDRRDDVGRLLRYEAVRRLAQRQGRREDADPSPARRLARDRAALLSTILADFAREEGPHTYGPIQEMALVRTDRSPEGQDFPVVARRRAAIRVFADVNGEYAAKLTHAILENSTDLDLEPVEGDAISLDIAWGAPGAATTVEPTVTLRKPDPEAEPDPGDEASRHFAFKSLAMAGDPLQPLHVFVTRQEANSAESPGAPKQVLLIFERVEAGLDGLDRAAFHAGRQVGLFAKTPKGYRLRLEDVRIIRNEGATTPASDGPEPPPAVWAEKATVRVVPMVEPDAAASVEAIQRWVALLPPCQEFLEGGEGGGPCVRVRLPVRFEETLLKEELPRLNGFEIYRQRPGDPQPVKIADGVPPSVQPVAEAGRIVLLVDSFLYGEEFPYNPDDGRFTGSGQGLAPGSEIRYFLRAVPYGRIPTDHPAPLRPWPKLSLYVPPQERRLPPLGLAVAVESLVEPESGDWVIPVQLVDTRPASWAWPEKGWETLEVWAEPQRIRSTGPYAVEDAPLEVEPRAAQQKAVRTPNDLSVERLPESVAGKVKVGELSRPANPSDPAVASFPAGGRNPLRTGQGCRLFIRPKVEAAQPLVEPLALFLLRDLPERVEEATPLLAVDRLELVARVEEERVMAPVTLGSGQVPRANGDAWLSGLEFARRTRKDEEVERFRVTWEHPGDLDAGVEVLSQDRDEPHRVARMLVTAREESFFQTALRDFRSPALWQAHPDPIPAEQRASRPTLAGLRGTTTSTGDLTPLILWRHERNPAIERVARARSAVDEALQPYRGEITADGGDWVALRDALAQYVAALLAYQRTPLAPLDRRDRLALDLLLALGRAALLGLKVDPFPTGVPLEEQLQQALDSCRRREEQLAAYLQQLAEIDLADRQVADTREDYERLKAELEDLDLARELAAIVASRQVAADDLVTAEGDDDQPPPTERLPGFARWNALLARYHPPAATGSPDAPRLAATLLAFFGDEDGTLRSTGHAGGNAIGDRIDPASGQLRDPSLLLAGTDTPARDYRAEVAKLVPHAAGLVAALDSLGRDAAARGWTLLRRPHHALVTEMQDDGSRKPPEDETLRAYLADTAGGSNAADLGPRPTGGPNGPQDPLPGAPEHRPERLVVPFSNLLERLGFALDLAVVDALNQPLPQRQLLTWIAGQPWAAIRQSIGAEHTVVLVTGREPDTDRDQPQTGPDEDQALGYAFAKLVVVPHSALGDLLGRHVPPDEPDQADLDAVRAWLAARSLKRDSDAALIADLEMVRAMAVAWCEHAADLRPRPEIGHLIVETRGRRWATVPVLGSRAHMDWTAPDAAGREMRFAARRVSRYEALLRWARGAAVPTLSRLYGVEEFVTELAWAPRARGIEEPAALPVLVSPHPTRIDFIYAQPTSGARATVSGLSARRTGYRGVAARFSHRLINPRPNLLHAAVTAALAPDERLRPLQVTSLQGNTWKVNLGRLPAVPHLVVFSNDRTAVSVSSDFVPDDTSGNGTLEFSSSEPPPDVGTITPVDVAAFAVPGTGVELAQDWITGTLGPAGADGTGFRITALDDQAGPIDGDGRAVAGQVLLVLDPTGTPQHARIVDGFEPADQRLTLGKPLPGSGPRRFRLLLGAPLPRREAIPHREPGVPRLFRHERLVSLPALPYYREYALGVAPQFEVDRVVPVGGDDNGGDGNTQPEPPAPVFARRRPSLLAISAARLAERGTTDLRDYTFRLVLSRQEDLLTPGETRAALELDAGDSIAVGGTSPLVLPASLTAADLPDLACQYQVLWRIGDDAGTPDDESPVFAVLADVVLPGHPLWKPGGAATPVMVINRAGAPAVDLLDEAGNPVTGAEQHVPLRIWQPTGRARPVYTVAFRARIQLPQGALFAEPGRAVLQLLREGYPSRPISIQAVPAS